MAEKEEGVTLADRIAQARRLKGAREWRDVPMKEMAEAADVTTGFLGKVESGEKTPSRTTLGLLARYLGTTRDWLEDGVGDPPSPYPIAKIEGAATLPMLTAQGSAKTAPVRRAHAAVAKQEAGKRKRPTPAKQRKVDDQGK